VSEFTGTLSRSLKAPGNQAEPVQIEIVRRSDAATLITELLTLALQAWTVMLAFGGLHSRHAAVPALTYVDVMLGLFILSIIGSVVRPSYRLWSSKRSQS
jgi:formate-dependent nitrite reductase membrane component NrfD